ncbi:ATP-binding cassette domain-containing protein [Neisseriaceae bacterium PsAf]|nr:ATP-binding cassette domain-containing protein [Neisseriaceae bacterium PsAf]
MSHLLSASQIKFQFPNSDSVLFKNISIYIQHGIHVLTGRNGVGKSIFAEILAKKRQPSDGIVIHHVKVGYLSQIDNKQFWITSVYKNDYMLKSEY